MSRIQTGKMTLADGSPAPIMSGACQTCRWMRGASLSADGTIHLSSYFLGSLAAPAPEPCDDCSHWSGRSSQ